MYGYSWHSLLCLLVGPLPLLVLLGSRPLGRGRGVSFSPGNAARSAFWAWHSGLPRERVHEDSLQQSLCERSTPRGEPLHAPRECRESGQDGLGLAACGGRQPRDSRLLLLLLLRVAELAEHAVKD